MEIPPDVRWNLIKDLPIQPVPPDGVEVDFRNPDSNAVQIYIFTAVCIPLVLLFAGLRVYAKTRLRLTTTWIDYYYLFSLAAGFAYIGLVVYFYSGKSFGHHSWEVRIKWLSIHELRISLILPSMISPVMWLVKLNLFLMFLQIFESVVWLKALTYFGILASGCAYAASMVANVYFCVPRDTDGGSDPTQLDYLRAIADPTCIDHLKPLAVIGAGANIAIDFYILIIPLPAVWSLRIPLRQRIGVLAIFATGFMACIASILSLLYKIRLYEGSDNTWDSTPINAVGILEISIGLIVPCMPAASKVIFNLLPSTRALMSQTSTSAKSSSRRPSAGTTTAGAATAGRMSRSDLSRQEAGPFTQLRSFDSCHARGVEDLMPAVAATVVVDVEKGGDEGFDEKDGEAKEEEEEPDWPLRTPTAVQTGFVVQSSLACGAPWPASGEP